MDSTLTHSTHEWTLAYSYRTVCYTALQSQVNFVLLINFTLLEYPVFHPINKIHPTKSASQTYRRDQLNNPIFLGDVIRSISITVEEVFRGSFDTLSFSLCWSFCFHCQKLTQFHTVENCTALFCWGGSFPYFYYYKTIC